MKTFITLAAVLFTLLSAAPARAQDAADAPFKDFATMRSYLASQGVNVNEVNWTEIGQMCMGLQSADLKDGTAYNKCNYQKARDSVFFTRDSKQCVTIAEGELPDSLLAGHTDTLTEKDDKGETRTFKRTSAPISKKELEQRRDGSIAACMQKLGWMDAKDWRVGKREGGLCP